MDIDSPENLWPPRRSLGVGLWEFLEVEVEAIMLFAWSHPEIGDPAELGFWQRALEAEVWWKYFDCGPNHIWARRTSQQVNSLWLSISPHASWDSLPTKRKDWWLDAKQRAKIRHIGPSTLTALIQYHEYLVFRSSTQSIRAHNSNNIETLHISDGDAYGQLESDAFPILPAAYVDMIEARRKYVQAHVQDLFQVSLLQLRPESQLNVINPLTLTPGPRIVSSADAPIQMSCEDNSLRLSFGPHSSASKSKPQLISPSKNSTPKSTYSSGPRMSHSSPYHPPNARGSSHSSNPHLVSASLALPASSKTGFSPQALPSSAESSIPMNSSSSHVLMPSGSYNSSFMDSSPKILKDWQQSEEFAEKSAKFNSFLQQLHVRPEQLHLLYCHSRLSSSIDFASFCQVYAMVSSQSLSN